MFQPTRDHARNLLRDTRAQQRAAEPLPDLRKLARLCDSAVIILPGGLVVNQHA